MAEIIPMLALSPTMEQAVIVKWNRREGDAVTEGDVLCDVETDKAVMEYEVAEAGTLLKILVGEGQTCAVGDPIAVMGRPGEDVGELVARATEQLASAADGPETPASEAPPAEQIVAAAPSETVPAGPAETADRDVAAGRIKASPLALRLAAEAGIDLRAVTGTGPGGRIIKRDIDTLTAIAGPSVVAGPPAAEGLTEQTLPVSPKRKVIARRLSESKFSAPHYYLTVSVSADNLLEARRRLNADRPDADKVALNSFLVKAAADAIALHPAINSTWQGETIRQHGSVDVALAVAQPDGLVAPVVRDCTHKDLQQIDRELRELIAKARAGTLGATEYAGATFTVTNLGRMGIEQFTAVINPPGSAILAVGQIRKRPAVDDRGRLTVESAMKMTLSCDHRVIDGVVGAAFLKDLEDMLEGKGVRGKGVRTLFR